MIQKYINKTQKRLYFHLIEKIEKCCIFNACNFFAEQFQFFPEFLPAKEFLGLIFAAHNNG